MSWEGWWERSCGVCKDDRMELCSVAICNIAMDRMGVLRCI